MAKRKTSSSTDTLRRQEIYEKAKTFEERVAELFRFLGYTTTLDYQRDALQFDVRLEMAGGPLPIHALVECKDTGKPAGQKQILEFARKVEHAKKADVLPYRGILVSRSGFVNNAHSVARQEFVDLLTFDQLILSLVDFGPNLEAAVTAFRGTELERLYVEQDVVVQSGIRPGQDDLRSRGLSETVQSWLAEPKKTFLALLGDFGAGKTSFCQRLACDLATRVREKPGSARIPVVIDLRAGGSTTVTLENLLTHHFQCLSCRPFNPQSFLYLNREGYLVLLFDGFDEVIAYSEPSRYVDHLRQILRAAEGGAKVILTCRTHYFRDRPDEIRSLGGQSSELLTEGATRLYEELGKKPGVDIAYLRELTEEQIATYLRKAIPPPGDWQDLREQIRHTYHLRDLAERPFLLEMIVKTLPKLQTDGRAGTVTVADLYSTYCESWFDHTDFRLTLTRERKVALVEHLARKVWNAPEQRVHYQKLFEECTGFFRDRPLTPHEKEKIDFEVRTALFLRRDAEGHYSFIHRSFLEFFIARTLRGGLQVGDPRCLDIRPLTREVVFFLTFWPEAERIPTLASQVLAGPYQPRISENALQLLSFYARSRTGPLVGKGTDGSDSAESLCQIRDHFQRMCPPEIHLERANLAGADLRGACLNGARLTGALLDRSALQGASLARANLENTSLMFADVRGASFAEAQLAGAQLEHAECRDADFCGADLKGANLGFAHFSEGVLKTATASEIEAAEACLLVREVEGTHPALARNLTFLFVNSQAELMFSQRFLPLGFDPVPRDQPQPLSFGQQRTWFSSQLDPNPPLTVLCSLELIGPFSFNAFQRAIDEIVRRHEILRASFAYSADVVQSIAKEVKIQVPLIDLRSLPDPLRRRALPAAILRGLRHPSDLFLEPHFRVALLAQGTNRHLALLHLDRIAGDERSCELLLQELGQLYDIFSQGAEPSYAALELRFSDFARWQRLEDFAAEHTYWRSRLSGASLTVALPFDRPRAAFRTYRGSIHRVPWTEELSARVRALSSCREATPLVTFLTGFLVLLGHYSRSEDLVVGLPYHGRSYEGFAELIGPFSNVLALRSDLSRDPSFSELLGQTRECVLAAYAHRDYPVERLIEELSPDRSLAQSPIVQVMFTLRKFFKCTGFDRLSVGFREPESIDLESDLILSVVESSSEFTAELTYSIDLFDATTAFRLLGHMENILVRASGSPETRLEAFELLSPVERHQALVEWNDTSQLLTEAGLCLHELFEAQARGMPNAEAVVFEGKSLTYRELDRLTEEWAVRLREFGVGPEVRVAVSVERSFDLIVSLLAVVKAGGVYVPLDPGYPRDRLLFMLNDCQAHLLLCQAHLLSDWPRTKAQVLYIDEPQPCVGQRESASRVYLDNICYMLYTSGSTGHPKGVMNTHRGIVSRLFGMQATYKLTSKDRVLQKTPFSFDISVWEIFWPLLSGACLVLARPGGHQDPSYLAKLIERERITTVHFVPSMLRVFLEELENSSSCTSLQRVLVSGEAFPPDLQRQFFDSLELAGIELHNLYGPTEAAIDITACRLTGPTSFAPLGRPVSNARVYLLNHEFQPVPVGVPGQLCLGGAQLARGYANRPALTAERFIPNPFSAAPGDRLYATGDLARYDADGSIQFLGRIDFQIKIRGFRIELGEIESAILRYSEVRDAVVIAREDSPGEGRLVAYIVTAEGFTLDGLRRSLQERLPEHMIPVRFVFLEALPLGPSGKVDRRALPAPPTDRPATATDYVAPRDSVEQTLTEIWSEVLGVEGVGIYDSFFALGGSSLAMFRVAAQIRRVLQIDLPIVEVFRLPTVALLATVIRSAQAS